MKERLILTGIIIILLSVSFSGCTGNGGDDETNGEVEEFTIGNGGGWVKPVDKAVSLQFLPGAVSEDITVTVGEVENLPEDDSVLTDLAFDFGP